MIESEEIFESAEETGFRLCAQKSDRVANETQLIFSATWDLSKKNRLYVCYQDGRLEVCDFDEEEYSNYRLIFRPYTANIADSLAFEKPNYLHWDKLVTLPERPNEIVFLIGISRLLMYTVLPGVLILYLYNIFTSVNYDFFI
jgi:hypothetical protein